MQSAVHNSNLRSQEDSRAVIETARNCEALEQTVSEHTQVRESVEQRVQSVSKQLASQQQQNKELQKRLDELSKEVRESKRQAELLGTNYEEKKLRQEQGLEEKRAEQEKLGREIVEKVLRNRKLENENVDLSEKQHRLTRENKVMRVELQNILAMVESLEGEEKSTRAQLAETNARLECADQDVAELRLEKSKLEFTGQNFNINNLDGNNNSASTLQKSGQNAVLGLAAGFSSLGEAGASSSSSSLPDFSSNGDFASAAIEKLQKTVLEATQGQVDTRQRQVEELEEKMFKLSEQNVDLQTRYEGLQKQTDFETESLRAQVNLLQQEAKEQGVDLEQLSDAKIDLERVLGSSKTSLHGLRKSLENLHSKTSFEITNRTKESCYLSKSMEQAKHQLHGSAGEREALEAQKQKLSVRLETLQRERLEVKAKQTEILTAERIRLDEERRALVKRLNSLHSTAKEREQQEVDLLRKQEEVRGQWREKLTADNAELKRQVDRLKGALMQNKIGQTLQSALAYSDLEQASSSVTGVISG